MKAEDHRTQPSEAATLYRAMREAMTAGFSDKAKRLYLHSDQSIRADWSCRLLYGLCCLFSGDHAMFVRIAEEAEIFFEGARSINPKLRKLFLRYASLAAAGVCAASAGCDRVTYPYENSSESSQRIVQPGPVLRYGGPVISLYAVQPYPPSDATP